MDELVIRGGKPLCGEVSISGSKNAAVAIIPAALLVNGVCRIENVPDISDVKVLIELLNSVGAVCTRPDVNTLEIDARNVHKHNPPYELARQLRASYYLLGALLGRLNRAQLCEPGGCNFGHRPIDQHEKGFIALGAKVERISETLMVHSEGLQGKKIFLDMPSVGATINIMLAAVLANGHTVIESAAKEPHVVAVAEFLNAMGANISGAGTDTIKIDGVDSLHGGAYEIIPDQIEAGTYMIAAAVTRGNVLVKNVIPRHMESLSSKLFAMGISIEQFDTSIRVSAPERPVKTAVKTAVYPGFPTDLQSPMVVLMALADGTSKMTEDVYGASRFAYIDELRRLGADITVDGNCATVFGKPALKGAHVSSTDLRGGAAVLLAGLAAEGETVINTMNHIDRGYETIVEKMKALGADLERRPVLE